MRTFVPALLGLLLSMVVATAQTNDDIKRALGETAGELQVCSVYFLVGSSCLADQRPDLAATYRQASDKLGVLAISSGRAASSFSARRIVRIVLEIPWADQSLFRRRIRVVAG
jgi:hypothetical protein